jgi:hypothetical protein
MRIGRSLCSWLIAIVLCHGRLLAQDSIPKFEVGPQFSYLHVQLGVVENQAGFGGKFGVNLHRSFAFDSELNFFPVGSQSSSSFDGGRITQGLFGFKGGLRKERFGVFGKLRPGFITFSKVITSATPPPNFAFTTGRLTEKCLDFGGVAELYFSRRIALRYDFGDTVVFYAKRPICVGSSTSRAFTAQDFQFSSSIISDFSQFPRLE